MKDVLRAFAMRLPLPIIHTHAMLPGERVRA